MLKRILKKISGRKTIEESEAVSQPEKATTSEKPVRSSTRRPRTESVKLDRKSAAESLSKDAGGTTAPGGAWRPSKPSTEARPRKTDTDQPAEERPAQAGEAPREGCEPGSAERPRRRRRRGGRGRRTKSASASTPTQDAGGAASDKSSGTAGKHAESGTPVPAWDPASFSVPPEEGKTRFQDLALPDEIMRGIADLGFAYCTPVQAEALPIALAGKDLAGRAQTGTGKTAAFLVAIFNHFLRNPLSGERSAATPRALVIAPTRELVVQIERDAHELGAHVGTRTLALFGGADFDRQLKKVRETNPELIVATPGRLLDFRSRHELHLGRVEIMVIDEADRMLDMGFIPDVRRIVYSTPPKGRRRTMLFSATLTEDVMRLASSWMVDPVRVDIEPEQVAVDSVDQKFYLVTAREKFALLYNILTHDNPERVLLFVNRRITAERLTRALKQYKFDCALISGALAQNQRSRTLEAFREGRIRFLVATDVAGRGLHIDGVSHVINYNIPVDAEDYVHRIGRTGRAGATGISITFACEEESFYIPQIESYIGRELSCEHPAEDRLRIPDGVTPIDIPDEPESSPRSGLRRGSGRSGPGRGGPGPRRGARGR